MATITKRGGRWSAQIRRKGYPSQSRTFATKAQALAWATCEEAGVEQGQAPVCRSELRAISLSALIDRYLEEVTPHKRSAESERLRLRKMQLDPIAAMSLASLTAKAVSSYRDRRSETVKAGTVRRELSLLHNILDVARIDWGLAVASNPVKLVRMPRLDNARNRRLQPGEFERLIEAASSYGNDKLLPIVMIAIETGMRRGEIVGMRWQDVDLARRIVSIPHTKTGRPRVIPLTARASAILSAQVRAGDSVFGITANALKLAWQRAVKKAGFDGLRFHDLRHEAVSRFFEIGLSLPEVALISGHRDPRMLMRYTHMRASELADKLRTSPWQERTAPLQGQVVELPGRTGFKILDPDRSQ